MLGQLVIMRQLPVDKNRQFHFFKNPPRIVLLYEPGFHIKILQNTWWNISVAEIAWYPKKVTTSGH